MAYLFAVIYLFHTYSGKDGNPMTLSYDDIVIAYTGSGKGSRLESALRGPMSAMLPLTKNSTVIAWVQEGADRSQVRHRHPADARQALHEPATTAATRTCRT